MKYTIIKQRTNQICLEDVDEETVLKYLKITKRLLQEKVFNKELVRGTWKIEAKAEDADLEVGKFRGKKYSEAWVEWFIEAWEEMQRRFGVTG